MFSAYKIIVNENLKSMLEEQNYDEDHIPAFDYELQIESLIEDIEFSQLSTIRESELSEESLYADLIWNEWFPEIKEADVFISHSRKDLECAQEFAYWLWKYHRLIAFIDSKFWGKADNLLRKLDNQYSFNYNKGAYNYKYRNISTSHVHMMLTYALTRMIDQTECFVFLKSETTNRVVDFEYKILSPWVFYELATVDTIALRKPARRRISESQNVEFAHESNGFNVEYPEFGKRCIEMSHTDLNNWAYDALSNKYSRFRSLDLLYKNIGSTEY